ncbi:hypothetical protein JHK82_043413 [Glycine max]|nr:hypothetical protein JHK82_043413 [Glycine max]
MKVKQRDTMMFYFKVCLEVGDFTIFRGLNKYDNDELIKYDFPEDIWTKSIRWNSKDELKKATQVILATDGDTPGQALAEKLAHHIGKENNLITYSQVLMYLGLDALKEVIENTKLYPIHGLFNFKYYFDEIAYDHRTLGYDVGITTRWNNPNDLYNPLMKFQLPKQDDGFDYYRNSSQDESRDNQGYCSTCEKQHSGGGLHVAESTSEWMNDSSSQKRGNYHDADFSSQYGTDSLKMPDVDLNSSISEGVGGIIRRSILSKGGVLQVYYVKVLEKGDTYEIIEKSLPKKQKNKSNLLSSETLPKEDEGADDQDALVDSLDAMPDEEEDPE